MKQATQGAGENAAVDGSAEEGRPCNTTESSAASVAAEAPHATEVVEIERMGAGPEAVAHLKSGKTVFVSGGAPGDKALVRLVEEKRSFARARVVEVIEPSLERVEPFCPLAGECGGCPWQHLSYEAQLRAKRDNVVSALVRVGGFAEEIAEALVAPCLPSKRQDGYRNKLELHAGRARNGAFLLGFHAAGSHDLVVPRVCPAACKPLQKAPQALQGALRFLQGNADLGIHRVGVRASERTKELEVALWTRPGAFPRAQAAKVIAGACKPTGVVRVLAEPGKERKVKGMEVLDGKGAWAERLHGARFLTSAPSFFQVNTKQAERLVDYVLEGLGDINGALVADLYAGGGTFSVPLAQAGAEVVAVESAGSSVRDLRRNADLNDVDIDVVGGDTARELPTLGKVDALVVDPPRAGLADGVVEAIAAARPKRVAYVSCNPVTWARDAARFGQAGYRLESAQPIDLFPQTSHVETASFFLRA